MNRSQRNAKAKAKGLRKARRKKKIDKIKNMTAKNPYLADNTGTRGLKISGNSNKYLDGLYHSSRHTKMTPKKLSK
jgi:hypothetical protein